ATALISTNPVTTRRTGTMYTPTHILYTTTSMSFIFPLVALSVAVSSHVTIVNTPDLKASKLPLATPAAVVVAQNAVTHQTTRGPMLQVPSCLGESAVLRRWAFALDSWSDVRVTFSV